MMHIQMHRMMSTTESEPRVICTASGCQRRLDLPPPDVIHVEYDPEDVDLFISVADALEDALPGIIVEGNTSAQGRSGSFEVVMPDGTCVFSRLESKVAPEPKAILQAIPHAS